MKFDYGLRQMALQLFGASLLEVCPKAILVNSTVTPVSFLCDFVLPFPLTKDYLSLIEERIRAKLGDEVPIESLEMVSTNAREYLLHNKQKMRAEAIDLEEQFADIVRIDNYVNVFEAPIETDKSLLGGFELRYKENVGEFVDKGVSAPLQRVEGWAFEEKRDLKVFRKLYREYLKRDHQILGLSEGEYISARGMNLLRRLQAKILVAFPGFQEVRTFDPDISRLDKAFSYLDGAMFGGEFGWKEGGGPELIFSDTSPTGTFVQLCESLGLELLNEEGIHAKDPLGAYWLIAEEHMGCFTISLLPLLALLLEKYGEINIENHL